MEVKIERLEDLFDEDTISEMIDIVDDINCCHYNAAMVCVTFDDWDCIDYIEGYLNGRIGHSINSYTDANGTVHYFDVTQEYYIREGLKDKFDTSFELVKKFSTEEIKRIFDEDGMTHLVAVDIQFKK